MEENVRASVIIPTYERPERLRETVTSVQNQSVDWHETVVVDDGSTDEQQRRVLEEFSEQDGVAVLRQTNAGPAVARNRGWRYASGEFVLFTDDDCIVPQDWVESLCEGFEPGIGGVGGPLVPSENALDRSVFARLHQYRNSERYGQRNEPVVGDSSVPMGGTANVAYRREVLEQVDGFDETFPTAAGEDADLQRRVDDAGYQLKYIPVSVVHNDVYDFASFVSRTVRHGEGAYYYSRRHGGPRPTWRVLAGLMGAFVRLVPALRRTGSPLLACAIVLEHALLRIGELRAS